MRSGTAEWVHEHPFKPGHKVAHEVFTTVVNLASNKGYNPSLVVRYETMFDNAFEKLVETTDGTFEQAALWHKAEFDAEEGTLHQLESGERSVEQIKKEMELQAALIEGMIEIRGKIAAARNQESRG